MNLIQLQPDDVLVVSHPSYLSMSQRDAMVDILRQTLGQTQRVLIIDAGQSLDVLRGVDLAEAQDELPTTTGEGYREVQHVDTDEPEAEGIPPHVWLYRNMLTDMQAVAPLGRDETNGQYAVAIDDLSDGQRAIPHVATQLALMEADRAAASTDRLAEALRDAEKLIKTNTST